MRRRDWLPSPGGRVKACKSWHRDFRDRAGVACGEPTLHHDGKPGVLERRGRFVPALHAPRHSVADHPRAFPSPSPSQGSSNRPGALGNLAPGFFVDRRTNRRMEGSSARIRKRGDPGGSHAGPRSPLPGIPRTIRGGQSLVATSVDLRCLCRTWRQAFAE